MAECNDVKIGRLRSAYGLGLLDPDVNDAFEVHVMECEYCYEVVTLLAKAADQAKATPEVVQFLGELQNDYGPLDGPIQDEDSGSDHRGHRPLARLLLVAAALVTILILWPWNLQFSPTQEVLASAPRLAVMYFAVDARSADSSDLGRLLPHLIASDLLASQRLGIVSGTQMEDLLARRNRNDTGDLSACSLAKEAGAQWLLTGEILYLKAEPVITARLIDVNADHVFGSYTVRHSSGLEWFDLADSLTARIRLDLQKWAEFRAEVNQPVAALTTHSLAAYRWYMEGVESLSRLYYGEATVCFRKAIDLDSTFAMAHYYLGYMGDREGLRNAVKYASRTSQRDQMHIRALDARYTVGDQKSREILEELLEVYPDEKRARILLGSLAMSSGDCPEAVKQFRLALEIDPLYKDGLNHLAYAFKCTGDIEQALAAADSYIEVSAPGEPNPLDSKGVLLAADGRLDEAIQCLEQVREIRPSFGGFHSVLNLGRLHSYAGDSAKALDCFEYVVSQGYRRIRSIARTEMALTRLVRGKLSATETALETGVSFDEMESANADTAGDRANKHLILALVYSELGRHEDAVAQVQISQQLMAEIRPTQAGIYDPQLIRLLVRAGDQVAADSLLAQIREKDKESTSTQEAYPRARGYYEFEQGHCDKAIEYLEKLRKAREKSGTFGVGGYYSWPARTEAQDSMRRRFLYTRSW